MEIPTPNPTEVFYAYKEEEESKFSFNLEVIEPTHPEALQVVQIHPHTKLSVLAMPYLASYNLHCYSIHIIQAQSFLFIPTRIVMQMPPGVYGRIASQSGLALKDIEVGAGVINPD